MLLKFTEVITGESIAVNPTAVNAVFVAPQGDYKGNTVISVAGQPIIVTEDYLTVVGEVNGALS